MNELMVAGFSDVHRAAGVLHELRQLEWDQLTDLDHAVSVARHEDGRVQIQQTVEPGDADSVTWSALWGALITAAMLTPGADALPAAAVSTSVAAGSPAHATARLSSVPPPGWWTKEIGMSYEFLRDVGAMILPGYSAIFMLVRSATSIQVATRLRRAGATVLRHPLSAEQLQGIRAMLDRATSIA
jgi:uncharacterized membrane protein